MYRVLEEQNLVNYEFFDDWQIGGYTICTCRLVDSPLVLGAWMISLLKVSQVPPLALPPSPPPLSS